MLILLPATLDYMQAQTSPCSRNAPCICQQHTWVLSMAAAVQANQPCCRYSVAVCMSRSTAYNKLICINFVISGSPTHDPNANAFDHHTKLYFVLNEQVLSKIQQMQCIRKCPPRLQSSCGQLLLPTEISLCFSFWLACPRLHLAA